MSLQFYLGRAGSGKTFRCQQDLVARLRQDPRPVRPSLWFLLPEQATAQAEAALLREPGIRGFARAQVVSFKRLAHLVLSETGGAAYDLLSEQGRQMLLRALVAEHRDALQIFAQSARESGFIARLARTFTELAQFRHSMDSLQGRLADLEAAGLGESLLARKLHDLALIGRAWEKRLGEQFGNPDHFLNELAVRIEQSSLLAQSEVWVDGFSSFMPQELRVMEAILKKAARVRVSLLLDPSETGAGEGGGDSTRLFAQNEETYRRLLALALDTGIEVEEPVCLPGEKHPTRFSSVPALVQLETRLCRSSMLAVGNKEAIPSLSEPLEGLPDVLPSLMCVEAASRRVEVEGAVRAIRRLCRVEGYRFRDIAVTVRDLDPYEALIRSAFVRHEVPFFLDRRRGMGHHPLVELIRSALRVLTGRWAAEDVVRYLKTDFAPLSRDEADRIENLVHEFGWRGMAQWISSDKPMPERAASSRNRKMKESESLELAEVRRRALAPLVQLQSALRDDAEGAQGNARPFVRALVELLTTLNCGAVMEDWVRQARAQGNLDLAEEHEQVWDAVLGLLSEMERSLDRETLALSDRVATLETGLESLTLGIAPPALDQVLIGTVERSRQPEVRAQFVLGLNEHLFPKVIPPDVILSDSDRHLLAEKAGMELAPVSQVRLFQERYLGYVALTRASQKVWASYALADERGKALAPSGFIRVFREAGACCEPPVQFCRIGSAWLQEDLESVERPAQAFEGVMRRKGGGTADETPEAGWRELEWLLERETGLSDSLNRVRRAALVGRSESLEAWVRGRLGHPDTELMTVSRLEKYALCPFKYYAEYQLRLKEREEFELQPRDLGDFHHAILEQVFKVLAQKFGEPVPESLRRCGFNANLLNWERVPEDAVFEALDRAIEDPDNRRHLDRAAQRGERVAFFSARARRQLGEVLKTCIAEGQASRFAQVAAEFGFGMDDSVCKALELDLGEEKLRLRGRMDRVDLARNSRGGWQVRILDFKSSEKKLDLQEVWEGLALQLPLYLVAFRDNSDLLADPAGAFFFPLHKKIEKKAEFFGPGPSGRSDPESPVPPIRMRGVFNLDALDSFCALQPGEGASFISVKLKKDGNPMQSGDWLESETFGRLLDQACVRAADWVGQIRTCRIAVSPVRIGGFTACNQFCPFGDLCRVTPQQKRARTLPKLGRKSVLEKLQTGSLEMGESPL
ncbi:MAG TPA: exodeoxyribonuclease V subunit gamma [Candidatus Sumerlaeota bacterium]|nr:exodeoxyribonuclease V subunit gamma [Candidatus Sumerlaeota bacterium]HPS00394.1 exodeoxyribonuclease V subunit gamma [Candidatus Sumerlaeota bacterium]